MHTISSFSTLENSAHFLFFHEWQPSSTKRTHATKRAAEAKEHGLGVDVWFPIRAPTLVRTGEAFAEKPEEDAWCEQQLLAMLQRRVMAMRQ